MSVTVIDGPPDGTELYLVSSEKVRKYAQLPPETGLTPEDILSKLRQLRLKDGTGAVLDASMRPVDGVTAAIIGAGSGCNSRTSREYALDIYGLFRYLRQIHKTFEKATQRDLLAYRDLRIEGPGHTVSRGTWERQRAPIEKGYRHLLSTGAITRLPFTSKESRYGRGGFKSSLSLPHRVEPDIRHLTIEQFHVFRDVGMGGLTPAGDIDLDFRVPGPLRNAVGADLALTTGMRLSEWSTVLDVEMPRPELRPQRVLLELEACAKGGYPRKVLIRDQVLRRIDLYRRTERAEIVRQVAPALSRRHKDLFVVTEITPSRQYVNGTLHGEKQHILLRRLPIEMRRIAVTEGEFGLEPMSLFLGQTGMPLSRSSWCGSFNHASNRLLQYRADLPPMPYSITSHMLRHTFAISMLSALISAVIAREAGTVDPDGTWVPYLHLIDSPLDRVRRLLGHQSMATTYVYLRHLQDSFDLIEEAFEYWDDLDQDLVDYALEGVND